MKNVFKSRANFSLAKETVVEIFLVGLALNKGSSNRVRSTSRGGRSPSAPGKTGPSEGQTEAKANGALAQGRRSRSISKVGIRLGA